MSEKIPKLWELPFKEAILNNGGQIYAVGGSVRDYFLGLESKDLDILITGIPIDNLESILASCGNVDLVGKSFGVFKFKKSGFKEIDITIPRTERPNGKGGYQGFDVIADHQLPLEKDLERRDFTINAMAMDLDDNVIDPFNGVADIKERMIRFVNEQSFHDDPLRMLRAIQFASRFAFDIEQQTFNSIKANVDRIKEISPERILIELQKVVEKGNCSIASRFLEITGLLCNIVDSNTINNLHVRKNYFLRKVKTKGEFLFSLLYGYRTDPAEFFLKNLNGDIYTYREIQAYELAHNGFFNDRFENRKRIAKMYKISPKSIASKIIPFPLILEIIDMKAANIPFSITQLKISGNDLINAGYVGKEIGEFLTYALDQIYKDVWKNDRIELDKICRKQQLI
jgi:hypothetical protein